MKTINRKKMGKINQRKGAEWERLVRKDLEEKGWIVSRWQNNVDLESKKLIPAKQGKYRKTSTGFPDYLAYRIFGKHYEIIGVECKTNGKLSKEEKEKIDWLLENNIFSKILIASKKKVGRKIEIKYEEFEK